MDNLKIGDVVQLKSGGPHMTIEGIGKYGYVDEEQANCVWFDGKDSKSNTFKLEMLDKVD